LSGYPRNLRLKILAPILPVADFFQPVNGFAVEMFLNGNARRFYSGRGAIRLTLRHGNHRPA
jgi:hypothetical protein